MKALHQKHKSKTRPGAAFIMTASAFVVISFSDSHLGHAAPPLNAVSTEQKERAVDQVASSAQAKSIQTLQTLLKRFKGKRQEPALLLKLAELQSQNSSIIFRIAHGKTLKSDAPIDLRGFRASVQQTIKTLDTLIDGHPGFEELASAYFLRGKAYEEIEDKKKAALNFQTLVKRYPEALEVPSAHMALAQFAIDDNDHELAIHHLSQIEKRPESPYYPFALYKLAWSHFNLKNIPKAMDYAERQVAFYRARKNIDTSEVALMENTLSDIPVFFIEGFETKSEAYSLDKAYETFQHLEAGKPLGKMLSKYSKLLRSHGHELALVDWKNKVLERDSARPEAIDVVSNTFEFQLNRRRYDKLATTAHDFKALYAIHGNSDAFKRAQKTLSDTAESLRELTLKNKEATEISTLTKTLMEMYSAFISIVEDQDPRVARVHYNLAETLFALQDYKSATEHYRWIVDKDRVNQTPEVTDAALKAMASRYETLKIAKLIPEEVRPRSLKDDQSAQKTLPPELTEWIGWIENDKSKETEKNQAQLENLKFEAYRSVYVLGHIKSAVASLRKLAEQHPKSTYAVPSASLVLDTYIASQDWTSAHETAEDFLDTFDKNKEFKPRLTKVSAEAFAKQIESESKAGHHDTVISMAKKYDKKYKNSERQSEVQILKGQAELQSGKRSDALVSFSKLLEGSSGNTATTAEALLSRARLFEDAFQFEEAANSSLLYFSLPADVRAKATPAQLNTLRSRLLLTSFLSGKPSLLQKAVQNKNVCPDTSAPETGCDRYKVIDRIMRDDGGIYSSSDLLQKATAANGEMRALWSWIALREDLESKALPLEDRLALLRLFAESWSSMDPALQLHLIGKLPETLSQSLGRIRTQLDRSSPLKATAKHIKKRLEAMRTIEEAATELMKIPFQHLRAEILSETAQLYGDFSRSVKDLPPPEDLSSSDLQAYEETVKSITIPFEEKEQQIREKAFAVASIGRIEQAPFLKISEAFLSENPSLAKSIRPQGLKNLSFQELNLAFLGRVFPGRKFEKLERYESESTTVEVSKDASERDLRARALWSKAVREKNWPLAQFFLNEAAKNQQASVVKPEEKTSALPPLALEGMKSFTLAKAGALSEALLLLEEIQPKIEELPSKDAVAILLLENAYRTYTRDKLKVLLEAFSPEHVAELEKQDQAMIALATHFIANPKDQVRQPTGGNTQR